MDEKSDILKHIDYILVGINHQLEEMNARASRAIPLAALTENGSLLSVGRPSENQPVSVVTDKNGTNWVRVQALGEDFCIGIHDLDVDDKTADLTKPQIIEALKKQGYAELTKKQGLLVCAFLEEINDMMKKAGGEEFAHDWYTCADFGSGATWYFYGTNGCFNARARYLEHFRCRPVIPYAQLEEGGEE